MTSLLQTRHLGRWLLVFALIVVAAVYAAGLNGGWLFDDYPNIVDNRGVQPSDLNTPSMVRAALSSPASELKRPLASLSFAANYLISGLHPYSWKLTNLLIHLLNGLLVFGLTRALLVEAAPAAMGRHKTPAIAAEAAPTNSVIAALVAAGWMLLPINLTGVLYVVQRMESMANLFVLLGLLGYVSGRSRMLASATMAAATDWRWFWLCAISVTVPAAIGLLAKETAVMLPLYAGLIEWAVFRFRKGGRRHEDTPDPDGGMSRDYSKHRKGAPDWRLVTLFLLALIVPMLIGLTQILPGLLKPESWATRDFTLGTRLLSEARIVVDYIGWTLLPTPGALSFYHDDFRISTGLLMPWTTLGSMVLLAALIGLMFWLRPRRPLAALGIALFLGCQLLTGTILPLELIYEHRNYFASFGLLLAIVPLLAAPASSMSKAVGATSVANGAYLQGKSIAAEAVPPDGAASDALPFAWSRYALLAGLMLYWTALTAATAYAWGDPLRLAEDLAARAPQSPRAQYELGRTYIIYSHYDPASPYTRLAYAPLEASAKLPDSSILPEQALIFMNARMQLPQKDVWWDSLIAKLKARKSGVQDESSLSALTQCAREHRCELPTERMRQAFEAALSHPDPSARLLATYGDYAWNVIDDQALGERMMAEAVRIKTDEPAYRITLIRMLVAQGRKEEARAALKKLETLNMGGRLNESLGELRTMLSSP